MRPTIDVILADWIYSESVVGVKMIKVAHAYSIELGMLNNLFARDYGYCGFVLRSIMPDRQER